MESGPSKGDCGGQDHGQGQTNPMTTPLSSLGRPGLHCHLWTWVWSPPSQKWNVIAMVTATLHQNGPWGSLHLWITSSCLSDGNTRAVEPKSGAHAALSATEAAEESDYGAFSNFSGEATRRMEDFLNVVVGTGRGSAIYLPHLEKCRAAVPSEC